jgi:hypothetical protein
MSDSTLDAAIESPTVGSATDMDRNLEVELLDQRSEVIGIGVEIIAVPRLARAAVPATIVGDASVTARSQKEHLVFESVSGERPAVAEDHRLPV